MYTLTREAQKRLDAKAEAQGLLGLLLMEQAGTEVFKQLIALTSPDVAVHVFCGIGKNAGDGYVLARLLRAADYEVHVWELSTEKSEAAEQAKSDSGQMRRALRAMGVAPQEVPQAPSALNTFFETLGQTKKMLFVDALIGTGYRLSKPLTGLWAQITQAINDLKESNKTKILSIDIPTGVDANTGLVDASAIQADWTVSFEYPKTGMVVYPGRALCGEIFVEGLGLSPSFLNSFWQNETHCVHWIKASELSCILPERSDSAYKNQFGHALLICGSTGMAGAALLAAAAALQSGIGLLTALVPEDIYPACLSALPSVMWQPFAKASDDFEAQVISQLEGKSALLFGSGAAHMPAWQIKTILTVTQDFPAPVILDAEALNYLAKNEDYASRFFEARAGTTVLTPHSGEFKRLAPDLDEMQEGRLAVAHTLAQRSHAYVVLKGAGTVMATPQGDLSVNGSGNRGMAKAGSGDVLAGMLLALCSNKDIKLEKCIRLAVFAHGLAADLQMNASGVYSVCAESILQRIPEALEILGGVLPKSKVALGLILNNEVKDDAT